MKRKTIVISATLILLMSMIGGYIFIKEKYKTQIVLKEDIIEVTEYTFINKKDILNQIDEENSIYETLDLILEINKNSYNLDDQLEDIYKFYNITLKDNNKIPIGNEATIKIVAGNKKNKIEKELNIVHKKNDDFIIKTKDGNELKETYTLEFGEKIANLLESKAYLNYFGQYDKELTSKIESDFKEDTAGKFTLTIEIPELNKKETADIIVEEKPVEINPDTETSAGTNNNTSNSNTNQNNNTNTNKPNTSKPSATANLSKINVLVNKKYHLNRNDVPSLETFPEYYAVDSGYRAQPAAVDAFIDLVDTMEKETRMSLKVTSSYRPYSSQERLFNNYVANHGLEQAMKFAAKPGESEHQTGLAIDVVKRGAEGSMFEFGNTKESVWLANNAHRFGFIIRYPQGKEAITGYQYEAWHIRYLGKDLATSVKNSGLTYDEYWEANFR